MLNQSWIKGREYTSLSCQEKHLPCQVLECYCQRSSTDCTKIEHDLRSSGMVQSIDIMAVVPLSIHWFPRILVNYI